MRACVREREKRPGDLVGRTMVIVDDGRRRWRESGGIGYAEGVRRNARERAGSGEGVVGGAPENPQRRH